MISNSRLRLVAEALTNRGLNSVNYHQAKIWNSLSQLISVSTRRPRVAKLSELFLNMYSQRSALWCQASGPGTRLGPVRMSPLGTGYFHTVLINLPPKRAPENDGIWTLSPTARLEIVKRLSVAPEWSNSSHGSQPRPPNRVTLPIPNHDSERSIKDSNAHPCPF